MKRFIPFLFVFSILIIPLKINSAIISNNTLEIEQNGNLQMAFPSVILTENALIPILTNSIGPEVSETEANNFIENNLAILYTICVILVLINLAVQIKIVYQMIHLFFQFRQKKEILSFKF
ncbi:MAG: hypothetical protein P1U56_02480 [Saprospiraceae bacterium]|nr:hypothetical protein [Saprospiraceae bacterium]